jgi:hypothetical protein
MACDIINHRTENAPRGAFSFALVGAVLFALLIWAITLGPWRRFLDRS